MVTRQNFGNFSVLLNPEVTISGLQPSTQYDIYCATRSTLGVSMLLSDVLSTKMYVRTMCCSRIATFTLQSDSVVVGHNLQDMLSIQLSSFPVDYLIVTVNASLDYGSGNMTDLGHGQLVTFTNPGSLTEVISLPKAWSSEVGRVVLSIGFMKSAKGWTHDFEVVFSGDVSFFDVLDGVSEPSFVPQIRSVVFSPDGSSLRVSMSRATNRGGYSSSRFPCAGLFNFTDVARARCSWIDDSSLEIKLPSSSELQPNDVIYFNGNVKAACVNSTACESWSTADATFASLRLPSSEELEPVFVYLTAPSSISSSDELLVDISSSVGSGGRRWMSFSLSVSGSSNDTAQAANDYFSANASLTSVKFPSNLFEAGTYSLSVTLCNYVSKCASADQSLTVLNSTVPSVVIQGSIFRTAKRTTPLELEALCSAKEDEVYISWEVSKDAASVTNVVSYSQEMFSFKVAAYSLSVGSVYGFTIKAVSKVSLEASSYYVEVLIEASEVVAVISGGMDWSATENSSLVLDGSGSFDSDIDPAFPRAAGLRFLWRIRSASSLGPGSSCPLLVVGSNTSQSLELFAPAFSTNSTCRVTLTVYDSSRSSSASVSVSVVSSLSPKLVISSAPNGRKFNIHEKLVLSASVNTMQSGVAMWSVNDSSVLMTLYATTNLTSVLEIPASTLSSSLFQVNLALSSGAIVGGSYLKFSLQFTTSMNQIYTSSVVVRTNEIPKPGTFEVSPTSGESLKDLFTLKVSLWSDEDLPLSYAFGYLESNVTGVLQSLRSPSQVSTFVTYLPAGISASSYLVWCYVQVIDGLGGYALRYAGAQVWFASTATLSNYTTNFFANIYSSSNVKESMEQSLSLLLPLLNSVDCSAAPDCASLHRSDCATTINTCGECLEGYYGEDGDSNSTCYDPFSGSSARKLLEGATPMVECFSSVSCQSWQECVQGQCVSANKTCSRDCSGHGRCDFVRTDTQEPLASCAFDDAQCSAVCACDDGYKGSACSYTSATLQAQQTTRMTLLSTLYNLTTIQDATSSTVVNWMDRLTQVFSRKDEVSSSMISTACTVLEKILVTANKYGVAYENVVKAVDVIDMIAKFSRNTSLSALDPSVPKSATSFPEEYLLKLFANLTLQSAVAGEVPRTFIRSQLRLVVAAIVRTNSSVTSSSSSSSVSSRLSASVATPLSSLEKYNSMQPFQYTLQDAGADVKLALSLLLPKLYSYSLSSLQSSYRLIAQVPLSDLKSVFHSNSVVQLHLQNVHPTIYEDYLSPPEPFNVFCNFEKRQVVHTCSDGTTLTASCTLRFRGWINSSCAYSTVTPVCAQTSSSGQVVNNLCSLTSYDSNHIYCSCSGSTLASDSQFDGTLQLVGLSRTQQFNSVQSRTDVSPTPTVEPSRAPTQPPASSSSLKLADSLTGSLRESVSASYSFLFLVALGVTVLYLLYSNRRRPLWDRDVQSHPAFGEQGL